MLPPIKPMNGLPTQPLATVQAPPAAMLPTQPVGNVGEQASPFEGFGGALGQPNLQTATSLANLGQAIVSNPYQEVNVRQGYGGRVDIAGIAGQDFQADHSYLGNLGMGAASLAMGNVPGAVMGLGAGVIGGAKQIIAKNEFERQKRNELRGGMLRNRSIDYRDHVMDRFSRAFEGQYKEFY